MRLLVSCLLLVAAAGCRLRPYESDPGEVNARYALKYRQPCNSWLRSSVTGYQYCASPAFAVAAPDAARFAPKVADTTFRSLASGETDQASLMSHGEKVYGSVCVSCHQGNGQGAPPAFPPLAGSGAFYGDARNHARIIVHGLAGEIQVQGVTYNGAMPPQGSLLSDYDVAAVATFERMSWGNNDGIVLPEDVAAIRQQ